MATSLIIAFVVALTVYGYEDSIEKDKRHYEHGHSADVDHEAFLGRDHAHDYDELSPDESKARLAALLPKVDTDGDGDIDPEELKKWIKIQIMDFVARDAKKALATEDTDKDGMVLWEEYVINTFGEKYLQKLKDGDTDDDDDDDDDDDKHHYMEYVRRDKVRFDLADQDHDMKLTLEEFQAFLHPEEFEHMADIVVEETMEDMDENTDGKISLAEYMGDISGDDDEEDDKEWLEKEKNNFKAKKDKNGDGFLDKEELAAWLIPSETGFSEEEANHLIEGADTNKDGVLSYQEVIDNYEIFVGSQATDYGRILHQEL